MNGNCHEIMDTILFDNCISSMKGLPYLGDNNGGFSMHGLIFPDMIKKQIMKKTNVKKTSHPSK